jgi:quercetin dioxygenase-like cupin family protein
MATPCALTIWNNCNFWEKRCKNGKPKAGIFEPAIIDCKIATVKEKKSDDPSQDAQRATVYNVAETVAYAANTVVSRKILNKNTGSVTVQAFDAGVVLEEKISAFDTLLQVLDGNLEVRIDSRLHTMKMGDCIIVPAHFRSHFRSEVRFKILLTVIKSGYEDSI